MANDKDTGKDNEEYQLGDADLMGSDLSSPEPDADIQDVPTEDVPAYSGMINSVTHRNALIVLGGLLTAFLLYSLVTWMSSRGAIPKENVAQVIKPPAVKVPQVRPETVKPTEVPSIQKVMEVKTTTIPVQNDSSVVLVDQKIKEMSVEQTKIQSNLQEMSANVNGVQTSVQDVNTKLTSLVGVIDTLNKTIGEQAELIKGLQAKCTLPPKIKRHHVTRRQFIAAPKYYIQAIIPGRAWLIRENGTATLTVREGTRIPGHGVVQLIDPLQGRVVLSSGAVITFGQWDS